MPVFLETICISQKKFKVTDKSKGIKKDRMNLIYAIPNLILLVLSILAMLRFIHGKYGMALVYSSFIIFWLLYNVINLIYAMYFLLGREIFRESDRIEVKEKITCNDSGIKFSGVTSDLSDTGLSFDLDTRTSIPIDKPITLEITTDLYKSKFKAVVVVCNKLDQSGKYRYRCKISDIDDKNKRQYSQIMHDREHNLTSKLNLWMTSIDGIIINAHKRIQKVKAEKRQLPRVNIGECITLNTGVVANFVDFNYRYVNLDVSIKSSIDSSTKYSFVFHEKYEIEIKLSDKADNNKRLFEIVNYESLIHNSDFIRLINLYDRRE